MQEKIKIRINFQSPENTSRAYELYLSSLESQITHLFPDLIEKSSSLREFYELFSEKLPYIRYSITEKAPYIVAVSAICHSQHTQGVGRFVSDMFSRWLIPGKQLPIVNTNSIVFEFDEPQSPSYFVHELLLKIDCDNDLKSAKANIEKLTHEIKLNTMAVEHARTIVALKPLTIDQKKMIVKENIAGLLDRPTKDFDLSTFDQMHHAIMKILGEEKVKQVREQVASLYETRSQVFERNVFNELQYFISLFKEPFMAVREVKHLTRIAAYMYLFRKNLTNIVIAEPYKRHLSLKILTTTIQASGKHSHVLGIIIGINLLRENEIFEEKHILDAMRSCLPELEFVQEVSFVDRRGSDKVRILYLEVAKSNHDHFNIKEIKLLRSKLPFELKSSIESMINPVFMPRNEEEVMRNILTLSKQLRYVHDLPQVIITFHKQTDKMVSFTVVLVRLLKSGSVPLKTLFSTSLMEYDNLDSKIVGQLRKKYPKEANAFEVLLPKDQFLRKDYSLDLFEARKKVYTTLTDVLGDIRDYNGGMISKQTEVFKQLTHLVKKNGLSNEFLLKNFFYSITPAYMQSLLSPKLLKNMYMMLHRALHHDYNHAPYSFESYVDEHNLLVMVGAIHSSLKDSITKKVENSRFAEHLVTSSMTTYDIFCVGYLLKLEAKEDSVHFLSMIHEKIEDWNEHFTLKEPTDLFRYSADSSRQFSGSV